MAREEVPLLEEETGRLVKFFTTTPPVTTTTTTTTTRRVSRRPSSQELDACTCIGKVARTAAHLCSKDRAHKEEQAPIA